MMEHASKALIGTAIAMAAGIVASFTTMTVKTGERVTMLERDMTHILKTLDRIESRLERK